MASAAQLWFPPDFDPYPKTFGANATVEIGGTISFKNDCAEGINDRFAAFADVYIVPTGSVSNGSVLDDVSAFDTVGPAAGGGFFESVIGFTKPSGAIPGGTYDIVYDECQDGKFDLFDSVFRPALIVDVPAAAVPDITGSIQAAKRAAGLEALPWLALLVTVEAVEVMQKTKAVMECLKAGGIAGCAVAFLVNKLQDYVKEQFYKAFMTTDPNEAAKIYVQNHIKKYAAIFLDPPDASFLTPSVVLLPPTLYSSSGDPLQAAQVAVGNAAGTEAALAEAFLHAIERYQGADAASEGDAALMQARAVQEYAFLLREQTARTSASLDDLVAAYAADTRPFEDVAPELEELRAQLEADGFSDDQHRLLLNLGASEADITALAEDIANDSYAGFSEAALADQVASIKNANDQVAAGLADTVTGMSSIIAALVADPVTLADAPIADAAGPYSGAAGTAIALDGSGSAVYPGRTVASYAWDLDGDGAFDDASGVAPNATFATGGQRVVGLRVTDSDGKTGIAYASVAVTATNAAPVISLSSPVLDDLELDVGDSMAFSVSATDSDGDALTIRWLVNGVEATTGPSFTYSAATAGMRIVAAQVSDGKPDGLAEREWGVSVLAPDADSDGWNANVDCADGDAEVHPDHREVVGNAKDDDCNASTPDTGSAPVAQFSQTVSPGLVVAFTDESTDANEDIVEWSWNFGDGSTSAAQNPSHTYTVKGLKTITLTVKDATNFTHTVTRGIVVASAPVASFTYLPPSPVGGSEVEFTDASTDSDGTIMSWAWTFGDGGTSAEQNPKHVYLGPGSFDVTLTVTDDDGSTGTITKTIVIGTADPGTAPVALFRPDVAGKDLAALANGGSVVASSGWCCGGHEPYQMLDDVVVWPWAVAGAGPHFATIQISSGTPRLIDSIALMPRADGYFDQRVKDFAIDVSTTGTAAADFTQVLSTTAADNSELQTFSLPANTTAKYVRYRPLSSRGSFYVSTTKFKVLSASSGPRRVTFLNQSTNAATYKWTFGDGSTSTDASPTHTYATVGTYTVTLTAKSADGRTSTVSRAYEARGPTADFSVRPGAPEPGVPAVFRDTSLYPSAPGRTFAWSFGDGTTSTSSGTLHTFAAAGAYTVNYTVTDAEGNTDSVTRTVTVAAPAADAAPIPYFNPPVGPENRGRNLALAPDGATVAAFSGQYDANTYPVTNLIDGNPSSNPWLTPNGVTTGWVTVKLSSTGPRMIDRVRLQPRWPNQAVKGFELAVSTSGADESSFVTVLTASAANNESLQTFALPYPMPATHLRYRILSNHAGGNYTATGDLRVDTGQEASTRTIRFQNLSRNATSYSWAFGDGSTSTDANPVYTYATAGTYNVTLTATNANGSTTFALEQVVRTAAIAYTPAAPEAQQQIDFLDASPAELGLQSWSWAFGDGTTSAFQHPVKTYAAAGIYTVTLTGTDREGNQLVATESVVIAAPSFRAQFQPRGMFNMASLENGAAVVAFSSQYDCCTWNAPKLLDAFTNTAWHSNASPPQNTKWIKFSLAGGQTYQLDRFQVLGRQDCCFDQHPRDFELAVSTTGTADADFKTVLRATLPANQTTLQTFQLPRPVLAKYVLYRTLNTRGAGVVTTAMLKALSGQVNTPTVTFDDLTVGGVAPLTYAWDFGDGGTSSEASPTHTFPGPGTYDVTLTVTDGAGATSTQTLRQKILNAPTPSFTNTPGTPNEAQSATFNDTTPSPADGPLVERRWTWADGTANTILPGASTTHTFADNGVYDVRLEVQDAWGQTASVTRAITVANVAPTVEAGPSWRWREDRALTATTTVADVAGARDPVTCTWTYGDGTPAGTGCSFSHTYANTGTYTATLTASDGDGGITTDTFTVEVIEQEVTGGGGGGGSGAAGGTGVGNTSKDYVYTLDGDFELGTLLNVNHDAPGADQLQLNKEAKPFPFVYIAISGRGTAVRVDVDTGVILGEYLTSPDGRARNPSRTTVDKLGNVWVTNRNEYESRTIGGVTASWGSTARIGLLVGGTRSNADGTPNSAGEYVKAPFEYNTCVDKNADGLIRTSRGLANILAWPNTSGVDHDGGVETAVDECIQFYVRVRGTGTRTVAITADNDAYIGGDNNWHERVDGETGERVPGTAFNLGCGGYGGLIDGNGILWSARYGSGLLRYNTNTKTGVCLGNGHGDYGLGVDPVTGHIWHTNLGGNRVVKLNPAATTAATLEIARYPHGNENAQGVAVDSKANVWVSHALFGAPTIGRVRTDGVFLGTPSLGPGAAGSTGVAVDANGKVWSANYNTSNASRIDPEIGQKIAGTVPSGWYDMIVNLGSGASPYNYSDMTGAVAVGAASPSGFWSIKQDGTALGTVWKRISWDGSTPGSTTITVEVRAADTQAELPSSPFVTATDGGALSGVVGRFIEVRATLQTTDPTATPILTDIRISANTPPVASGGTADTPKDTPRQITLAATDDDGDALTYEIVDAPLYGTVTILGNVATYTPVSGYTGPDSFTFKARDASGESNVATVTLNVIATNEPPVANDLAVSTPEDVPLGVALPATDPDGDLLTLTYVQPANGSYDGTLYTPNANYFGPDSFIYTATDPDGESDTGTVSITVTPVNDGPTADDDGYAIDEDTTLSIPAPGILANDDDVDGDTLSTTLGALPVNGTLTYGTDGSFTYQPNLNFSGSDSFTYRAGDGLATSTVATVSISVRPVNDAPTAAGDGYTVDEDTTLTIPAPGILANDGDVDGDALSTTLKTLPVHGTLTYGTDGSFMYQPDANYFGLDSFTYRASDGLASSDVAAVSITVRPVNDAPVANDQSIATDEDTSLSITLGADDVDNDSLTYALATAPQHGTWDGTTYTPALNYNGPDSFDFLVSDGNGLSDTGTITITVRPVNDAPNVENRTVETAEDTPLPIALNGSDVDDATLTITTTQPSHGSYAGGIYTPDANYSGADSFQYTATDAAGLSDTATVTITVRPVNDAPNVGDRALETDEDTPLPIALAGDDIDGDTLTITTTSPSHGTYAGGVYTPAPNYHGPDSFQYTANDGNGGTDTATVTITVRPVNDAPVAGDQSVATNEDTPLAITLGATDADGDSLAYALASAPLHGTWDGTTYTPTANYNGPDSFDFLVSDGNGPGDVGTVSITVRPVNDAPAVDDRSVATDEDTPLPIALDGSDIDGDALTFTTTAPGHGTYAGGVYAPAPNYNGPDSFDYTATDAGGASDTATVTITVRPVNDPPDALDLAIETDEDTTVTVGFAGTDPEGDALTFAVASPPAHGSFAGNTYTPAADYNGPDSFTYTADDGNGGTDTATVTITVRPVNDPPTVTLAGPTVTDEGAAPVTFTATAVDPDGGSGLTYSWTAGTGTLTPAAATAGYENDDGPRTDTVTVTVSDGSASASAAASIAVRNVAPNASAGLDVTEFWGLPIVFTGSATDPSDADTAAGFAAQWAFGDGTLPVAGLAAGHVYAQPGAYTATFGATDKDGGSDADTTAVTIGKRPTAVTYGGPTSAVYGLRTLSATLVDEVDEPTADLAGRTLVFRLGTRTFSALTNAAGIATVTSVLPLTSGTVVVEFAGDGRYLPSSTEAELTILTGPGKITGGGLRSLNHPGRGGFNVHSASKGELQWQNGTLNFHAPELTALGIAPDGRTAWFAGTGRDGRTYVSYVEDNGEPGRADVFKLWIAGVLQTPGDGKLSGGNIQIHK